MFNILTCFGIQVICYISSTIWHLLAAVSDNMDKVAFMKSHLAQMPHDTLSEARYWSSVVEQIRERSTNGRGKLAFFTLTLRIL